MTAIPMCFHSHSVLFKVILYTTFINVTLLSYIFLPYTQIIIRPHIKNKSKVKTAHYVMHCNMRSHNLQFFIVMFIFKDIITVAIVVHSILFYCQLRLLLQLNRNSLKWLKTKIKCTAPTAIIFLKRNF